MQMAYHHQKMPSLRGRFSVKGTLKQMQHAQMRSCFHASLELSLTYFRTHAGNNVYNSRTLRLRAWKVLSELLVITVHYPPRV